MNTILVHNLDFVGLHGVYEEERIEGRRFAIDIEAIVSAAPAGKSDPLDDTVDYRDLARIALEVGRGPSVHLIERLAEQICERIFAEIAAVAHLTLTIRKYATGVPGAPEWVGLRVERARGVDPGE